MSICFSESDLGDWTGDCESLDETPLPSTRKLGGRSGADVILLATFPPAGVTLAEHLVNCRHLEMPRRVHEQVLEVTKTVTMMEIVNSAPDKHPRSCEVTITNIASDTGHPISLKISHLHTMQNVDHRDSGTQTPDIEVQEQTWDAIQRAPDGTSHIEQELATRVERFRPRRAASGTTFNLLTDNLIDLQFTQPVLSETHDQQRRSAAARVSSQGGPAVQKLYYRPFAEHDGSEHSVADPPEAVRPTPQNDRRSVVDEADVSWIHDCCSLLSFCLTYAYKRTFFAPPKLDKLYKATISTYNFMNGIGEYSSCEKGCSKLFVKSLFAHFCLQKVVNSVMKIWNALHAKAFFFRSPLQNQSHRKGLAWSKSGGKITSSHFVFGSKALLLLCTTAFFHSSSYVPLKHRNF